MSWGGNCSGNASTRTHGSSQQVQNTADGYDGDAQFVCQDGSFDFVSGDCNYIPSSCSPQDVAWGGNCSSRVPSTTSHGSSATACNGSASDYEGCASFVCNDGSLEFQSGACDYVPSDCSGGTQSWGAGCRVFVSAMAHGQSRQAANIEPGFTGSATFSCNDGSVTRQPGATCTPDPCPDATLTWDACRASVSAAPSGSAFTFSNERSGYTGEADYACTNGQWVRGDNNCAILPPPPDDCAADTQTWGGGCSAASPDTGHQGSVDLVNTNPAFVGNANYTCNDGNMVLGSQSCVPAGPADCQGERLTWDSGCSDFASGTDHGSSVFLRSSSSSRVGSATYVCNDGDFELEPGSNCESNSVCDTSDPILLRLCAIYRKFYDRVPDSGGIAYYTNEPSFVNGTSTCQEVLVARGTQSATLEPDSDCARFAQNMGYKPIEAKPHACDIDYYNGTRFKQSPEYRSPVGNLVDNTAFCSQ